MKIPLTKGMFAEIDDEDENLVMIMTWQAMKNATAKTWYARGQTGKYAKVILMHRLILNIHDKPHLIAHHKDHNGLNNKRSNLIITDHTLNHLVLNGLKTNNSSGVTGVYWSTQKQKWHAEIKAYGKKMHLGFYDNIQDAAAARLKKEKELCLDF